MAKEGIETGGGPSVLEPAEDNACKGRALLLWSRAGPFQRRLVLFVLGIVAGAGFAPLHLLPAWLIGWAALIWTSRLAASRREVFLDAWMWGLGVTIPGIYWITSSFLIDAPRFGWLAPPVIGALGAYLALYPALALLVAWHFRRNPWSFILVLACAWTISEWARAWVLTGFPWNLASYIWAFSTPMMQSAAIWGAWGLSLVTIVATGALSLALGMKWRSARRPLALVALGLALLYAGGWWRLAQPIPPGTGVVLRLVQANISQWDKLTGRDREGQIVKHLDLSAARGQNEIQPQAIIWPETAATLFLDRETDWRRLIGSAAPAAGFVITGGLRGEPLGGMPERYWNSLYVIDRQGAVRATFDKFHLVPLGEFVPLRRFLPFVSKLTGGAGNFSSGSGPVTINVPGIPSFSPLICYEIIFPGAVALRSDRPGFLLNITNDGWFGQSSGPYQHFATARFRAVEEGLPLIRSANSGISGAVDAMGRIVAASKLGEVAVLDVALPASMAPTLFHRWGLVPVVCLMMVCAVLSFSFATHNSSGKH